MSTDPLPGGPLHQAALQLSEELGIPVFPCRARDEVLNGKSYKSKTPHTEHGFQDASRNLDQIDLWWARWPDALVGVPTGRSSRLVVVDIDPDGLEWYRDNAERLGSGRIHRTLRGFHLLYRMPEAMIKNSASKLAKGVDVRGEGGYIVWWPASGLVATGDMDELCEPPEWLVRTLAERPTPKSAPEASPGSWGTGQRNARLASEAGRLRRIGCSAAVLLAALQAVNAEKCSPPLDSAEVAQIAASVARYEPSEQSGEEDQASTHPPRSPLDWPALDGKEPPAREWAMEYWLPQRHPCLLAGRGGIGKTLLAQHIATGMILGHPYVAQIPKPLRVLMWAGEDDDTELWRRQIPIAGYFGVRLADLKDKLIMQSYEGCDITLAAPVFGVLQIAPMLKELMEQVNDYKADYVFLDNIARIYGGNESDRHSVTQFLAWVSAACRPAGVCLLGHPAKGFGSEYSGSTAWEGAVRARLYLGDTLPDAEPKDADELPDPALRYFARRKSNYSPNDYRRLNYMNGVLVPEEADVMPTAGSGVSGEFARNIIRTAVSSLKAMGQHGNSSTRSAEYLPKLAKQFKLLDRLSEKHFGQLMRDMMKEGELRVETVGRYSNRSPKPGLVLR